MTEELTQHKQSNRGNQGPEYGGIVGRALVHGAIVVLLGQQADLRLGEVPDYLVDGVRQQSIIWSRWYVNGEVVKHECIKFLFYREADNGKHM